MQQIDLKDRKILYQLDLNCRQSNTQIGKKVGLSKQVVDYRIKKMEENGLIKGYYTVIDSYKLGYSVYRYYIVLQSTSTKQKQEIIDYLANYKNTFVVASLTGKFDISVLIWIKSIPEFYRFWDDVNDKYGDFFSEKVFSVYVKALTFRRSYLLQDKMDIKNRDMHDLIGVGEPVEIDKTDYKLLNELSVNAREVLLNLASKINFSPQTVKYRMDNLSKIGVIQAFRAALDIGSLGYKEFKLDIYLKETSKRKKMIDYLSNNPNIVCISTSAGYADIETEFEIENADKMLETIEDVKSKFPGVIRKYTYFSKQKFHKMRCIPEIEF